MKRTTLGVKSQVVMPKAIQQHLGIGKKGDQVGWAEGPDGTAILRGFRAVPTDLISPELNEKLDRRERSLAEGRGIRVRDLNELRRGRRQD